MLFRYNSPFVQIIIVSLVCFCCPGMFNALDGLGGAGKAVQTDQLNASTALAVTFALFSLLGGGAFNLFGHRALLFFGGLTYAVYVGSYLTENSVFVVFSGALLGFGAGFLWTAQGAIMISYPTENTKGRAFSVFWMIFNLGGVLGSLVPLILNLHSKSAQVANSTYIAFIVIMCFGACLSLVMLSPYKVEREDGTKVALHEKSNVSVEVIETLKIFTDWRMLLLIPLFGGSNWFYVYQFNDYNSGGWFNIRTVALNNLMYWVCQIVGAGLIGLFLDTSRLRRSQRAWGGLIINFIFFAVIFGSSIKFQLQFTREEGNENKADGNTHDFTYPNYAGDIITYMLFGACDATYQSFCYWLMGTFTNDNKRAARMAGYYKFIQNVMKIIPSQLAVHGSPYILDLGLAWGICAFGMILAIPVIASVTDHTDEIIPTLQAESIEPKETTDEKV